MLTLKINSSFKISLGIADKINLDTWRYYQVPLFLKLKRVIIFVCDFIKLQEKILFSTTGFDNFGFMLVEKGYEKIFILAIFIYVYLLFTEYVYGNNDLEINCVSLTYMH